MRMTSLSCGKSHPSYLSVPPVATTVASRSAEIKAGGEQLTKNQKAAEEHFERAVALSSTDQQRFNAYVQKSLSHIHRQTICFGMISLSQNKKARECYQQAEAACPGRSAASDIFWTYLDRYSLQLVGNDFSALEGEEYGVRLFGRRFGMRLLPRRDQEALRDALKIFPCALENSPQFSANAMRTVLKQKLDKTNQELVRTTVIPALQSVFQQETTPLNAPLIQNARESAKNCLTYLTQKAWARDAACNALRSIGQS